MNDYIIRGTAANDQVRFFAAYTKDVVETARQKHNTSPVATAALGRLLTAGAMMGSMCKNDSDVITLQIQCSGPIGGLTVTADSKANVKGYVNNPDVMLPPSKEGKLDVGKALDLGVLTVIKDIGLKEPYSGQTHLVSGEIAEDLTYYFAASEQIPTSVALGVLMNKDNNISQTFPAHRYLFSGQSARPAHWKTWYTQSPDRSALFRSEAETNWKTPETCHCPEANRKQEIPEKAAGEAGQSLSPYGSARPLKEYACQNIWSWEACNPETDNTTALSDFLLFPEFL